MRIDPNPASQNLEGFYQSLPLDSAFRTIIKNALSAKIRNKNSGERNFLARGEQKNKLVKEGNA